MKKLALVAGGLLAINTVANLGLHALRATGGSVQSLAFIVAPLVLQPAPITYNQMVAEAD